MDPFGLAGYSSGDSDSDTEKQSDQHADDDSQDTESTSSSLDSAGERALLAAARIQDFGDKSGHKQASTKQPQGQLPSVLSAFDEVDGPPSFLDPEATRPIATSALHGRGLTASSNLATDGASKQAPGPDYDISKLAPLLKGQKREAEGQRGPPGSVIEGKAKRYKEDDGPETSQQYSALQIAMLGGHVPSSKETASPGPSLPPGQEKTKKPSQPMEVSEFLNKGEGTALLPRKGQDRKDKEKLKRQKGQSSAREWKSEAEMVLRQQYDS